MERARDVHARVARRVQEEVGACRTGLDHADSTLRILVATDQHLGYKEEDEVRREDAFAALEECCTLAETMEADLMLFGGDLFHSNNPSRWCLTRCIEILRRHCVGAAREVAFDVLNDEGVTSREGREVGRRCSHMDPAGPGGGGGDGAPRPTGIPCFAIHGNHDDPGGTDNLSALDVLSAAGLVNYFGKFAVEGSEDGQDEGRVRVRPVLLKKGETRVALYGMGNIRDERMARLMFNHKVKYRQPQVDRDAYFNLMALHQNRINRGYQFVGDRLAAGGAAPTVNSVAEAWLPTFMDFVVWGHEHECIAEPWQSVAGQGADEEDAKGFYVTQPGSTVATSLVEGESKPKHCLLLEVRGIEFRCTALPLRSVRPFKYDHVVLRDVRDPGPLDPDDAPAIERYLERRVRRMIQEADDAWYYEHEGEDVDGMRAGGETLRKARLDPVPEPDPEPEPEPEPAVPEGRGRRGRVGAKRKLGARGGTRGTGPHATDAVPAEAEGPRGPLPLIRLRVDYTGHSAINSQRFGLRFVGKVANPQDMLTFSRRRTVVPRDAAAAGATDIAGAGHEGDAGGVGQSGRLESDDLRPDDLDERLIDVLVKENLRGKGLGLLPEEDMLAAVDSYVHKDDRNAIRELVDRVLKDVGEGLEKCSRIEKPEDVTAEISRFLERRRHEREMRENADPARGGRAAATRFPDEEDRPLPSQRPASQVLPDADAEDVLRRYGGLLTQTAGARNSGAPASDGRGASPRRPGRAVAPMSADVGVPTTPPRATRARQQEPALDVVRSNESPGNSTSFSLGPGAKGITPSAGSQATRMSARGAPRARRGGGHSGARAAPAQSQGTEGVVLPSLDDRLFQAPSHPAEDVDLVSDEDEDNDEGAEGEGGGAGGGASGGAPYTGRQASDDVIS